MSKLLCVFCSSSGDLDRSYHEGAEAVGRGLAARGWGLIYGGGGTGLMGSVARAAKAAGTRVVGVIPEFMKAREFAFKGADEIVTVSTMAERKQAMIARADAFLALPGAIGTLEEFMEVLVLRHLGRIDRPAVIFNQNGYYDDLLRFFGRMTRERFKSDAIHRLYAVASAVDARWPHLADPAERIIPA